MSTDADRLTRIWGSPPGIPGFLTAVNHKQIGLRFILTSVVFFVLAGISAVLIRTQLALPEQSVVSPQAYQELFTLHGTAMMFLFAVPIMEGFAMYLVPLMIGARDLPFPRLNALGYWCFLLGGVMFYSGVFMSILLPADVQEPLFSLLSLEEPVIPDGGWFAYPPLTGPEYSPGSGLDFWLLGISFVEISAIIGAIELIIAILRFRAPGMTLTRMPLFVWSILVVAFMMLFAFPPILVGSALLEVERATGLPFYSNGGGGDPLLWQHLFWIFGHPEVYVISIPATGLVAMMIAPFARRPIVGYAWLAVSAVGIGFLSFGVWVHHMYTTGLPMLGMSFFAAAGLMIAIPTGVQIFAFIATIWSGRIWFRLPMLWVLAFLSLFVIGGITGVMIAVTPFDWQVHDSYFIVGHFHYVLIPGAVMPVFGAFHYWWPKMTGRMLNDALGYGHFILFVVGFNLTFLPMHVLGLQGMPRRVFTFESGQGWEPYNLIASIGAYMMFAGVLLFLINLLWSIRRGSDAGPDPWNGNSLEWSVSSPPPPYNYLVIPTIQSRNPVWDNVTIPESDQGVGRHLVQPEGDSREMITTSMLDAKPLEIIKIPGNSYIPLVTAAGIGLFFGGILFSLYLISVVGILITAAGLIAWHLPEPEQERTA